MGSALGRASTATVAALVRDSSFSGVVGEGHPDLDGLAHVAVGHLVGLACLPRDVGVVPDPLVGEGCVVQAVGVSDAGRLRPSESGPPVASR